MLRRRCSAPLGALGSPPTARVERNAVSGAAASSAARARPVEAWIGVVDGLVKMTTASRPTASRSRFAGMPTGGWFGEGSLLKDEPRRYDIVALRRSRIAYMPRATFMRLLDTEHRRSTASC